jgi:outer membrane protein OmpA-like peptidoglycan-associated protein
MTSERRIAIFIIIGIVLLVIQMIMNQQLLNERKKLRQNINAYELALEEKVDEINKLKRALAAKPILKSEPTKTTAAVEIKPVEKQVEKLEVVIFFEFDKKKISKVQREEIKKIEAFIKKHNKVSIEIRGYTDKTGKLSYNKKLSQSRAGRVFKEISSLAGTESFCKKEVKGEGVSKDNKRKVVIVLTSDCI